MLQLQRKVNILHCGQINLLPVRDPSLSAICPLAGETDLSAQDRGLTATDVKPMLLAVVRHGALAF